jgi:hypothetical protein
MARPQPETDQEELGELPPMDGDAEESGEAPDAGEKNLEIPSGEGGLDDEVADEVSLEEAEIPVAEGGGSWLNEEADASDLDLGAGGTIGELTTDSFLGDDEPSGGFDEGTDLRDDSGETDLDGGDEGPLAADDELRDEDLPALDSDDEGDGADAPYLDASLTSIDPLAVAWATRPWPRVGAPLRLAGATSVACAGRYVLVALRAEERDGAVTRPSELVHIDLEGSLALVKATGFDGPDVEALANDGTATGIVAMVLRGGRLVTSTDGGAHFEANALGAAAADCVVALGRIWVRTQSGSLLASGGRGLAPCVVPGPAKAIASDGVAAVAALIAPDQGGRWGMARFASDTSVEMDPIADDGELGTHPGGAEPREQAVLAIRAGHVAYCPRTGVVRRMADGRWRFFAGWEGYVTGIVFVDDGGTLVVATYSEAEDVTELVRIDASGTLSIVARVGAFRDHGDSDGRVLSLACDDARGVVWLAGGFGVAAFSMGVD